MRRPVAPLVIVFCLLPAVARADIVEIPLPGLVGPYPVNEQTATRTVTLQLPQRPDLIRGASLRITGTSAIGVANCGGIGEAELWPMEFIAEMPDGVTDTWMAFHEPSYSPGQFIRTALFEPLSGTASWEFLMDGEGQVGLTGAPASAQTVCDPVLLPTGNISEAVFIIDADFPLPVRVSTWGRIKALYRP